MSEQANQSVAAAPVDNALVRKMRSKDTHSARALLISVVNLLLIGAAGYLVFEIVRALMGRPMILFSPLKGMQQIGKLPEVLKHNLSLTYVVVAILAIVGLFLFYKALAPGHLNRRALNSERYALVADDSVLASCMSLKVREFAGLPQGQVKTTVSKGKIFVYVVPSSGRPLDHEALTGYANHLSDTWGITRRTRVKIQITKQGKVRK